MSTGPMWTAPYPVDSVQLHLAETTFPLPSRVVCTPRQEPSGKGHMLDPVSEYAGETTSPPASRFANFEGCEYQCGA